MRAIFYLLADTPSRKGLQCDCEQPEKPFSCLFLGSSTRKGLRCALLLLATISPVLGIRGALYRAGRARGEPSYGKQDFLRFGRSNMYGSVGQDLFAGPLGEYFMST